MTDSDQVARDAAAKLFAAWERWDLDAVGSLVADDAVDERPQSGERFVGRSNIMGMYAEVPGPPRIRWRSIVGGPSVWVAEVLSTMARGRSISSALSSWPTQR
jgi:SnoaL-like domain